MHSQIETKTFGREIPRQPRPGTKPVRKPAVAFIDSPYTILPSGEVVMGQCASVKAH